MGDPELRVLSRAIRSWGFMLREDGADLLSGDISLIKLGIDSHQDDVLIGFEVVNDPITTALATLTVAVRDADFKECEANMRNLVAKEFADLELPDDGLDVLADMPVSAA
jgi:hypothetical protein